MHKNRNCRILLIVWVLCFTAIPLQAQDQDMRGVWDGFLQSETNPPEPVRTEITSQENRRFTGQIGPPDPVQPVSIEGTVSASGKVNIQGTTDDGERIVGKSELTDFGNGAAIYNGTLVRPSFDNRFIIPCILVMRAFVADGSVIPDPGGRYSGVLTSAESSGQVTFVLSNPPDPVKPTSFDGTIEITLAGQTHTLQMLGTINGSGRIIGIAHKNGAGHMVLDAALIPASGDTLATIRGIYRFELEHGVEYEGSFEAPANRGITATDG